MRILSALGVYHPSFMSPWPRAHNLGTINDDYIFSLTLFFWFLLFDPTCMHLDLDHLCRVYRVDFFIRS